MKKLFLTMALMISTVLLPAQDLKAISNQFINISDKVNPVVVTITAEKVTKIKNPFGEMDFPFEFFGLDIPDKERELRSSVLGSGVLIEDGYVLTNNHVIENADEIKVVLNDKREFNAELVGTDPKTDIGILKITGKKLPVAKLGDSDKLRVGEWVLAVGSPYSKRLGNTVTHGIISGLGRSGMNLNMYENYIQTDAPINPGNSGGALVNLDGEVIGINSAIVSRSGGSNGIGFAIPVNLAKKVMKDLISEGRVIRAWLGVSIQELNQDLSESLDLDEINGVLITDVVEDSPAAKSNMRSGDVVIRVNDNPVSTPSELQMNISSRSPGDWVRVDVIRDGKEKTLSIRLSEMPDDLAENQAADKQILGLTLNNNTDELAEKFGYKDNKGVVITDVAPASESYAKGLRAGQRLLTIERKHINSIKDVENVLKTAKKEQVILVLVESKNGNKRFITLKVD